MLAYFKTRCGCYNIMEFIAKQPYPEYRIPLRSRQGFEYGSFAYASNELNVETRRFKLVDYRPITEEAFYEEI
jgi:hypothetical protein